MINFRIRQVKAKKRNEDRERNGKYAEATLNIIIIIAFTLDQWYSFCSSVCRRSAYRNKSQ